MKIKDCMCNNVHYVKADCKVSDVINLMNSNHIGCVPICDDENKICGILTDRDILLRSTAYNKDNCNTLVSDIMTTNVCTCNENDEICEAEKKMAKNQIRRIPICNQDNKIVGILTLGDLAQNCKNIGKEDVCETLEDICSKNQNSKNSK